MPDGEADVVADDGGGEAMRPTATVLSLPAPA